MTAGRNDPCPCGSGKKHKKCCLKSGPDPVNYLQYKLNLFHNRIVGELFRHGEKIFNREALESAADEFFAWPDAESEDFDLADQEMVFYPWFLFKWRLESGDGESTLSGPRNQSIVQSYLLAHGKKLDPVEREYLEHFGGAPFTFFEITAVEPGESVFLRDLLLDSEHQVLEKLASRSLRVGDVVYGSVFEAGGIVIFGALATIPFRPSAKVGIIELRERMAKYTNGRITADTLEEYDLEIRDLYLALYLARTARPALCNTDGDKLSFHSLKYTISSSQRAFDALKGLTNGFATEEDLLAEADRDANGKVLKVEIPWLIPANVKHAGMENTLHGRLFIDGPLMTCEVNSAERAERLRALIEKSLPGGEATYKISAEAKLGEAPPATASVAGNEELMNQPEVRAHIEEMMRKHWEAWPDLELPALQGRTPRQAVRDELGRRQVNAILEDAEYNCRSSKDTMGGMEDLQRVRSLLGLETP